MYPTEMAAWLSSSQTCYGQGTKVSSKKLYYMEVQLGEDPVVEFDGARQDIFQEAVNLIVDNYLLFESAGIVLPYYLDRGTGRSSNRILLSTDKSQVGNMVLAAIDSDWMLLWTQAFPANPITFDGRFPLSLELQAGRLPRSVHSKEPHSLELHSTSSHTCAFGDLSRNIF